MKMAAEFFGSVRCCAFVVGIPLMILEYALGHREQVTPPLFLRTHLENLKFLAGGCRLLCFWGLPFFIQL